eukprot:1148159-Pelagomonas_calceolata.AAC.3
MSVVSVSAAAHAQASLAAPSLPIIPEYTLILWKCVGCGECSNTCEMAWMSSAWRWALMPIGCQDGRLVLPEGTCVSKYECHGEEIDISSSSCLMLGVEYAVVWQNLEVQG